MTINQFEEAKNILETIKKKESQIIDLKRLLERITVVYNKECENSVHIQIAEKWTATPIAEVNKNNFINFLNTEICRIKLEIKSMQERLEEL